MPKRRGQGIELLADPLRRQIIAMLALRVRRPRQIAAELGLSAPTISYHLRLLREAGLIEPVRSEIDNRVIDYSIASGAAGRILAWLVLADVAHPSDEGWPGVPDPPPDTFDVRRLREAVTLPTLELLLLKEAQARATAQRRAAVKRTARREARVAVARWRGEGLSDAEIRRRRADERDEHLD
jgi:DNA-binding transcriptional ArsR family regulator